MINRVMLVGRLGDKPEIRHLDANRTVSNFSVATVERWKDKSGAITERTDWHKVIAWGNLATYSEQFLFKGTLVYVEGKIQTRTYQDKSGQNRSVTEILAQEIRTLDNNSRADIPKNNHVTPIITEVKTTPAVVQPKQDSLTTELFGEGDIPF